MQKFLFTLILSFFFSSADDIFSSNFAFADSEDLIEYEPKWDANHPKAMSESWTWMGHLKVLDKNSGEGVAFIHYYTRNKSKMGSLTFKTSALTPTVDNVGKEYRKQTLYSSLAKDFYFKTHLKKLDLEWHYQGQTDHVKQVPFEAQSDYQNLDYNLLPLFPNLHRDPQMQPIKSILSAHVGKDSHLDLTLYSIWQPRAPTADGRIRFLGVDGTFTFFHPMIVAVGTWTHQGVKKRVAGLLTLDRQWSNEYFGKSLFEDSIDYVEAHRALSFAHHWSFFHGYLPNSKTWIFVHLWNQFYRHSDKPDQLTNYSNLVWVKNGKLQNPMTPDEYNWKGNNFVLNQSEVLLNFGAGREGHFPSQFDLNSITQNIQLNLKATPNLQSLDQPIYLYEGYGNGDGIWNGEPIAIQGRLESSRLLFRDQDYQSIIETINSSANVSPDQMALKTHLQKLLVTDDNCSTLFCHDRIKSEQQKKEDYWAFITNDMNLKMSILKRKISKKEEQSDRNDPDILTYY